MYDWEGVLLHRGVPSLKAPSGARGHRIVLSYDCVDSVIEQINTQSLPLFASPCLKTHDATNVIGTIQKAALHGKMLYVAGSLISQKSVSLKAQSDKTFGLSYDALDARVADMRSGIWIVNTMRLAGITALLQSEAAHRTDCLFWMN